MKIENESPSSDAMPDSSRHRSSIAFAVALAAIAFIWLVAFPWLSERPTIRARIERERAAGIDPGAMFYTELPAMDRLRDRMTRIEAAHPGLWWNPRADQSTAIGTRAK